MLIMKNRGLILSALPTACLFCIGLVYQYRDAVEPIPNHVYTLMETSSSTQDKTIFIANRFSSTLTNFTTWTDQILNRIVKKQCPESRCKFVDQKENFRQADAVIVSLISLLIANAELPSVNRLTDNVPQKQIWILAQYEPWPLLRMKEKRKTRKSNIRLQHFNGWFNWTMSFRQDSEIELIYGSWKRREDKYITKEEIDLQYPNWKNKQPFDTKKPLVVWMASHCDASNQREEYVKQLQEHMKVDVFGSCGPFNCSTARHPTSSDAFAGIQKEPCFDSNNQKYAFVISFENSFCKDYATEKVFNGLLQNLIPIVLAGDIREDLYPPHSAIYAGNFETPKQLSEYLFHLVRTPSAYQSYFNWRYKYELENYFSVPSPCELCAKLHDPSYNPDTREKYAQITDWLVNQSGCKEWRSWTKNMTMSKLRGPAKIHSPHDTLLSAWRRRKFV